MGTTLSPMRESITPLQGLTLRGRGKIRDNYTLAHGKLLPVATDAISIFDFVLNALIPEKGIVLNALTHFWFQQFRGLGINTHFVAAGQNIDEFLPEGLKGNPELQSRAIVVDEFDMHPVEFIARGYLTGSGLRSYLKSKSVCGHPLPKGLQDGDQLPYILDTPTTKAEGGHDENLNADEIRQKYPEETYWMIKLFQFVSHFARQRGIILADTKLEFGKQGLGDEIFTPDSSRFWNLTDWEKSRLKDPCKAPPPFDKELVRAWGLAQEINKLDPSNPDDVAKVHGLIVPEDLIRATTQTYRYIFWRLTEENLDNYCKRHLGVSLGQPLKKIAIIFGSKSDLKDPIVNLIKGARVRHVQSGELASIDVHTVSCHRNPADLRRFVLEEKCRGVDAIIAAGGKALALPGDCKALINEAGLNIPVVGVALGKSHSKPLSAAQLSIDELPEQPVVMDEINNRVYTGPDGLQAAIERTVLGEFPPPKPPVDKPAKFDVDIDNL